MPLVQQQMLMEPQHPHQPQFHQLEQYDPLLHQDPLAPQFPDSGLTEAWPQSVIPAMPMAQQHLPLEPQQPQYPQLAQNPQQLYDQIMLQEPMAPQIPMLPQQPQLPQYPQLPQLPQQPQHNPMMPQYPQLPQQPMQPHELQQHQQQYQPGPDNYQLGIMKAQAARILDLEERLRPKIPDCLISIKEITSFLSIIANMETEGFPATREVCQLRIHMKSYMQLAAALGWVHDDTFSLAPLQISALSGLAATLKTTIRNTLLPPSNAAFNASAADALNKCLGSKSTLVKPGELKITAVFGHPEDHIGGRRRFQPRGPRRGKPYYQGGKPQARRGPKTYGPRGNNNNNNNSNYNQTNQGNNNNNTNSNNASSSNKTRN